MQLLAGFLTSVRARSAGLRTLARRSVAGLRSGVRAATSPGVRAVRSRADTPRVRCPSPRFGQRRPLYYSVVNPHGFPSLLARSIASGAAPATSDATAFSGTRSGSRDRRSIFDQIEVVQPGRPSVRSVRGRPRRRRPTAADARARVPPIPTSRRTVTRSSARSSAPTAASWRRSACAADGQPSVPTRSSPRRASALRRRDGRPTDDGLLAERGTREIVLDRSGGEAGDAVRLRRRERAAPLSAVWMPDGTLIFASDREGAGSGSIGRITRPSRRGGSKAPGPMRDRRRSRRTAARWSSSAIPCDGYDLFSLPTRRQPMDGRRAWSRSRAELPGRAGRDRSRDTDYVAGARSLFSAGGRSRRASGRRRSRPTATSSWSAPRRVARRARPARLRRSRPGGPRRAARPDWQIAYAYDRWWPTLFVNVPTIPIRGAAASMRTREANAGCSSAIQTRSLDPVAARGGARARPTRSSCDGCHARRASSAARFAAAGA